MTTLAASEMNGGTLVADDAALAETSENEEPVTAEASGAEDVVATPAPRGRRRGATTMSVVEANGGDLGTEAEAASSAVPTDDAPGDDPSDEDMIAGIAPHPTNPDGTPRLPENAAARIAAGERGEIYDPTSEDEVDASAEPGYSDEAPDEDGVDPDADPEHDEFPTYDGVDALHEEFMSVLTVPRRLLRKQIAEEVGLLKSRRGEVSAQMDALMQQNGHHVGAGGRPGLFSGLMGRMRRDPVKGLNDEAVNIDQAVAQRRAFQRRILDAQYRQMTDAADAMYRYYARLDREVKEFNAKFAASKKGANFLKALDYVADKKGITVDDLRARINDPAETDESVAKLRARQEALRNDPEFAEDLARIDNVAEMMTRHGDAFRQNLEMLHHNGVDLTALDGLGEKLRDGMKIERPLLSEPGSEGRLDKLQESVRRITEELLETIQAIIAKIFGATSGPRA